ncbi:hypothetical protein NPIL_589601, partial [Nephila pilipes]
VVVAISPPKHSVQFSQNLLEVDLLLLNNINR